MKTWGFLALSLLAGCGSNNAASTPRPPAGGGAPARPTVACVIEGAGEPSDLYSRDVPPLTIAATRSGPPLIATQGKAREELEARWSELAQDGRAHVVFTRPGNLRVSGYADLASVQFRLRNETPVVPGHVFLQKDTIVHVTNTIAATADVLANIQFDAPTSLKTQVNCNELAYDAITKPYGEPNDDPSGNIDVIKLYDQPNGKVVFEGKVGLMFIHEHETKDGFVRIEGARYRVRIDGYTPVALVDHEHRGSGYAGSSRHGGSRGRLGRAAHTTKTTPLLVRVGSDAPIPIGELPAGAPVKVFAEGTLATIDLADFVPVDGAVMLVNGADLDAAPATAGDAGAPR